LQAQDAAADLGPRCFRLLRTQQAAAEVAFHLGQLVAVDPEIVGLARTVGTAPQQ